MIMNASNVKVMLHLHIVILVLKLEPYQHQSPALIVQINFYRLQKPRDVKIHV